MKASQTGLVIFKKGRKKNIAGNFRHMIPAFFKKVLALFFFQFTDREPKLQHDVATIKSFFFFFQICVEKQNAKSSVSSTHF